jgi:hypothetical protein
MFSSSLIASWLPVIIWQTIKMLKIEMSSKLCQGEIRKFSKNFPSILLILSGKFIVSLKNLSANTFFLFMEEWTLE